MLDLSISLVPSLLVTCSKSCINSLQPLSTLILFFENWLLTALTLLITLGLICATLTINPFFLTIPISLNLDDECLAAPVASG